MAQMQYRAELLAYMAATGVVTDDHKRHATSFMKYMMILFAVSMTILIVTQVVDSCRMSDALNRDLQRTPSYR